MGIIHLGWKDFEVTSASIDPRCSHLVASYDTRGKNGGLILPPAHRGILSKTAYPFYTPLWLSQAKRILEYCFLFVRYKCKSLLLWYYSSYRDETFRICRTISTICVIVRFLIVTMKQHINSWIHNRCNCEYIDLVGQLWRSKLLSSSNSKISKGIYRWSFFQYLFRKSIHPVSTLLQSVSYLLLTIISILCKQEICTVSSSIAGKLVEAGVPYWQLIKA